MIYPAIIRAFIDVNDYNSQFVLSLNRGDSAKQLQIFLTVNGERYNPGEYISGTLTAVREDGEIIPLGICQYLQDGRITYDIDTQLTGNSGKYDCQLVIKDDSDGAQIACARFRVIVEDLTMDTSNVAQSSEFVSLQGVLDSSERLLNDLTSKRNSGYFNGNGIHVMDRAFEGDGGVFYLGELQGNGNVARGHSIIDLSGRVFRIDSFSGNSGAASYSGITLHGKDGATFWLATVAWGGTTTLSKESVSPIEGKEITVGDFVIYTNSEMHRVETVTTSSIVVETDGVNFKGKAGYTPQKGIDYFDGEDGYTPQKGVDYWTEDDKAEVEADITTEIASQLADRTQLTPEFANSIEECTDTSKLYVLPDGYIYAYILTEIEKDVNILPSLEPLDGLTKTSDGLYYGYYAGTTAPGYAKESGCTLTGIIPCVADDFPLTIYVKGTSNLGDGTRDRIGFTIGTNRVRYVSTFTNGISNNDFTVTKISDGYYCVVINASYYERVVSAYGETPDGVIMSFDNTVENQEIIVATEPIEGGEVVAYQWTNTERAFVSADYGDRVTTLETGLATVESEIGELQTGLATVEAEIGELQTGVPEAVISAASELVTKTMSREYKGDNLLRFLISSDAHHKNNTGDGDTAITLNIIKGTKELGQAHSEILKLITPDFVSSLGDITWGSSAVDEAAEKTLEEAKVYNQCMLENICGSKQIHTEGNHETMHLTHAQLQSFIYNNNHENLVIDSENWLEGYGYMDFPNHKVRVVVLNTNQATGGDESGVNEAQLQWFAKTALNMEGKTDWSLMTMSHHPMGYPNATIMRNCASVLRGFIDGASINKDNIFPYLAEDIEMDYSNKNCQYIGHFHGHTHAFSVTPIRRLNPETTEYEEMEYQDICIPNACFTRNNQNLGSESLGRYSTETTYNKVDEDGKRTSFNLVTIDLDDGVVYADNFGVGPDRIIGFGGSDYNIVILLDNCDAGGDNSYKISANETAALTFTARDGYSLPDTVSVTGATSAWSQTDGTLTLSAPTGDVKIMISAE